MELNRAALKQEFIKRLHDYSQCITPVVRDIQERYVSSYYIVDSDKIDVSQYCQNELKLAQETKEQLQNLQQQQ
ncbi:UNKNOWN [Stylonychia lemnae]|uniref:Uncharacterized protein n=1 Tax=Stylonychia lemnae TaxID=5949 RepID=A0A077ZR52_STYLE|nr:UNKNOWN [Stylonychia lemnae]|eukprot:CDW71934.1 UNKNOWN [Stylonychia lemnae]